MVVLYHSGLMHIQIPNIKQHLQSNLSTLSDARNDCINNMILTVQVEKEWQQNVDTIDQCWDELLENRKQLQKSELKQSNQRDTLVEKPKNDETMNGRFVKQGNQLKFISNSKKK